jgi:cytochrome P450 family 9
LLILELKDIYTRCTTDVIATTAFGLKVDSLQQPTNKFYMMGQEATNFGLMKWFVVLALPKIMKVSQDTVSEKSPHVQLNTLKP